MKEKSKTIIRLKDKDALKFPETGKRYWKLPDGTFPITLFERFFSPSGNELFMSEMSNLGSNDGKIQYELDTGIYAVNIESWIIQPEENIIFPYYGYE